MSENIRDLNSDRMIPQKDITPSYDIEHILGEGNIANIVFNKQVYILRKTRQNKLILTK